MKYVMLLVWLSGCGWIYDIPEPQQASTNLQCRIYQTPVFSDGSLNATVQRCHDPVLNIDYNTVLHSYR